MIPMREWLLRIGMKKIRVKWKNAIKTILLIWSIYSILGLLFGQEYETKDGNICKGYQYGVKICAGDKID